MIAAAVKRGHKIRLIGRLNLLEYFDCAVVKRLIFFYTAGTRRSPLLFTVLRLPTDVLMLFAAGLAAYFCVSAR